MRFNSFSDQFEGGLRDGRRLDSVGARFFRPDRTVRAVLRFAAEGGLIVDWLNWLGLAIALLLAGYLSLALMVPERFS
jgi:K+-transporting ATPase KdpF subunit